VSCTLPNGASDPQAASFLDSFHLI